MGKRVVVSYFRSIKLYFAFNVRFKGMIHGAVGYFITFRKETPNDG